MRLSNGSNEDVKCKPAVGLSSDDIALLTRDLDTSSKCALRIHLKFETIRSNKMDIKTPRQL